MHICDTGITNPSTRNRKALLKEERRSTCTPTNCKNLSVDMSKRVCAMISVTKSFRTKETKDDKIEFWRLVDLNLKGGHN
jgi:hypothetical protein